LEKILIIFTISFFLIGFSSQSFAQTNDKLVVLHTNLGNITIEFFPNDAPNHVSNFIKLTESGFYDGTLFHRVIPGFMIQGGDPNTKTDDESIWGMGGPSTSVKAEFNNIKHNRGIVSMARAQDPDSAGSQFFIVHQDSNFLDEQYTVFGRIVTQESFDTLDKIASVETKSKDIPIDIEKVRILKAEVVNRSQITDLLKLDEPKRSSSPTPFSGSQLFESKELGIAFSAPAGWLLQQPEKTNEDVPDIVAVGPKTGLINPLISLKITDTKGRSLDDLIAEKNEFLRNSTESGNLKINSQERIQIHQKDSFVTNAQGTFQNNGQSYQVKFDEIIIYTPEKFYIFSYSNGIDDYNNEISKFQESVDSFSILSEKTNSVEEQVKSQTSDYDESQTEKGGGCLIATAAFGSELAPQVQQLRELRDNTILSTKSGSAFMTGFNQMYYSFSPTIADMERENPIFKETVKIALTPMLTSLSLLNYVDINSEEEMLGYGITIIAMNIGMYFVAPAMIVFRIRK
jgi:peptidyl-prolyl cis-trans isomerase B (cyclophilin B)